jgi:cell division protein ZapA (FtsZ GTPase activity inhibitor)
VTLGLVEIEILERRYTLQSDRSPEHVKAVAAYVDEQLRAVAGGRPDGVRRDHAILTALNIASELFLVREQRAGLIDEADRSLASMQALLDRDLAIPTGNTGSVPR